MEGARDLALEMANVAKESCSISLIIPITLTPINHYRAGNLAANRRAHYPFCLSMGTTGTITGVSRFMREQSNQ